MLLREDEHAADDRPGAMLGGHVDSRTGDALGDLLGGPLGALGERVARDGGEGFELQPVG